MKNAIELQNLYVKMYSQLRNYIWGLDTVEKIAEIEMQIYSAFPDCARLQKLFASLYDDVHPMFEEDEELEEAMNAMKNEIQDLEEGFFFNIDRV